MAASLAADPGHRAWGSARNRRLGPGRVLPHPGLPHQRSHRTPPVAVEDLYVPGRRETHITRSWFLIVSGHTIILC